MDQVRTALNRYRTEEGRFPGTLDSLTAWLAADPAGADELRRLLGEGADPDSLIHSPRTGKRFGYARNDTGRVEIYLLQDPDSDDRIGSDVADVTLLNAASWE
jgi:hypothetical protein